MIHITRRELLQHVSSLIALSAAGGCRVNTTPKLPASPFTLGVASGDPAPDGVVLWTRLALDPLQGGGGMPPREAFPVQWEVAKDERMQRVVQRGTMLAKPAFGHAVHVEVRGLQPWRPYFYRFTLGPHETAIGRTRTAPAAGAMPERLRFAFASCQRWETGYFTAYDHMVQEDLDLVIHLGDYIYEYGVEKTKNPVRPVLGQELSTLDDYRLRYALYRTDPALRAAHERFPFIVTPDDHEVDNDYANDVPEDDQPRDAFLRRRANAYRAYYEHMPLRASALPFGPDAQLYRRAPYGTLADFLVLDTRQYRTDQPCGKSRAALCADALSEDRTILGARQERWLREGLDRSPARWNVIAQQVMLADVDFSPGPARELLMDKWSGYQACSRRVHAFLRERRPSNPIVLTGDIHSNWVLDLKADYREPDKSETLGVEFVGTSITSGGDGQEQAPEAIAKLRPENPHVRFYNNQRGYVSCTVTPDRWQSDYRVVPFVTRPDAPIETRASFIVENGRPGAQPA
jgi:alkaline phosphatase D